MAVRIPHGPADFRPPEGFDRSRQDRADKAESNAPVTPKVNGHQGGAIKHIATAISAALAFATAAHGDTGEAQLRTPTHETGAQAGSPSKSKPNEKPFIQPPQPTGNLDLNNLLEVVRKFEPVNRNYPISRDVYWEVMICLTQKQNIPHDIEILDIIAEKNPHLIIVFQGDLAQHKNKRIAASSNAIIRKAMANLKVKDPKAWEWVQSHSIDALERERQLQESKEPQMDEEKEGTGNESSGEESNAEKRRDGRYVHFPSGISLKIVTDKAVLKEWKDKAQGALDLFRAKFGKTKKMTDIDQEALRYVKRKYNDRVPVVKIESQDLDKKVSRHFQLRELVRIDTKKCDLMKKNGTWEKHAKFMIQDSEGNMCWSYARIDPNLCRVLDTIRDEVDFQVVIDEGVRPYGYNFDMYRASGEKAIAGSPHTSGRAVDLLPTGNSQKDAKLRQAIVKALDGKGGGFGNYGHVYHVDVKIGPSKAGGSWVERDNGTVGLRLRQW